MKARRKVVPKPRPKTLSKPKTLSFLENDFPIAKVFTVTKNETDLIESFILYHGKMFGYRNIIIIDRMSTCPIVKGVYYKYIKQGVTIVYENSKIPQGVLLTKYMNQYKKACKFLIGLDTDEFIYLRGQTNTPEEMYHYLNFISSNISKIYINMYFSSVPDLTSPHFIDQKISKPATQITTFQKRITNKCIFRANNFISANNGCNGGKTSMGKVITCQRFVYFHFNNRGPRQSMEKAKNIVHEHGYANTSSFPSDQLKSLFDLKPITGRDSVFKYGLFLSKLMCLKYIINKRKWPKYEELSHISKTFPTIFNRDIDVSQMECLPQNWELKFDGMVLHDTIETFDIIHTGIKTTIEDQLQPIYPPLKNNVKKIALLLSGHVRNFNPRKDFWIDFNRKFRDRVDIYVHTWNESGIRSRNDWIDVGKIPPDFQEIRRILQPSKMLIENHSEKIGSFSMKQPGLNLYYTNSKYLNTDFTKNIGSQLYSVMKSWELARDSNVKYDMMIRMRNDCVIDNFENVFRRDTSFLKDDVLIMNGNSHRHAHGGGGCGKCRLEYPQRNHTDHSNDVCDIMYLGNPTVMAKVCNMFKHSKDLVVSFKNYNKIAVQDSKVRNSLVKYQDGFFGVNKPIIFETKLKCFYPERLIREYMKDYWLITDMLGLVVKIIYN